MKQIGSLQMPDISGGFATFDHGPEGKKKGFALAATLAIMVCATPFSAKADNQPGFASSMSNAFEQSSMMAKNSETRRIEELAKEENKAKRVLASVGHSIGYDDDKGLIINTLSIAGKATYYTAVPTQAITETIGSAAIVGLMDDPSSANAQLLQGSLNTAGSAIAATVFPPLGAYLIYKNTTETYKDYQKNVENEIKERASAREDRLARIYAEEAARSKAESYEKLVGFKVSEIEHRQTLPDWLKEKHNEKMIDRIKDNSVNGRIVFDFDPELKAEIEAQGRYAALHGASVEPWMDQANDSLDNRELTTENGSSLQVASIAEKACSDSIPVSMESLNEYFAEQTKTNKYETCSPGR